MLQEDRYTPAPGQAECPTCGAILMGAPTPQPALQVAGLGWRCPICGQVWVESYTHAAVARMWHPRRRGRA